jgi:hypothetical protein
MKRKSKDSLKKVKCECGKEILLVPDLKAMTNAIEAHVQEHSKKLRDPILASIESDRLWNVLVALVFKQASSNENLL